MSLAVLGNVGRDPPLASPFAGPTRARPRSPAASRVLRHYAPLARIARMPFLRCVAPKRSLLDGPKTFPFSVRVVRALEPIELPTAVTFFVGENGSGKSTLLEGIAAAVGLPTVGSESLGNDATLATQRARANELRLSWSERTHRGFFLRAEDFFGFTKYLARLRAELQSQLGLIAMLKEMVGERSQFIIPTHSPILLAFPGATIYSFDERPPRRVPFEELEHVRLTRDFLNAPDAFIRRL